MPTSSLILISFNLVWVMTHLWIDSECDWWGRTSTTRDDITTWLWQNNTWFGPKLNMSSSVFIWNEDIIASSRTLAIFWNTIEYAIVSFNPTLSSRRGLHACIRHNPQSSFFSNHCFIGNITNKTWQGILRLGYLLLSQQSTRQKIKRRND